MHRQRRQQGLTFLPLFLLIAGCHDDVASTAGQELEAEEGDDGMLEGCGDNELTAGEFCHTIEATSLPSRTWQAGDFNADGNLDVGTVTAGTTLALEYWAGDGAGVFAEQSIVVEMPEQATVRLASELDGEPGTDFLIADPTTGELFSYLNVGGVFQPPTASSPDAGMVPWNSVTLIDSQGDGVNDILVEPFGGVGPLQVLANSGGSFQNEGFTASTDPVCSFSDAAGLPGFSQFAGGLVFLAGECGENGPPTAPITVLLTRDNGQLVEPQTLEGGTAPTEVLAGDFNGDGVSTFVVWDSAVQVFRHFSGGISGTFEEVGELQFDVFCIQCGATGEKTRTGMVVGEFDGVGGDDVLVQEEETTFVTQRLLQGDAVTHTRSVPHGSVLVADFNADGVDDIMVSHNGSEFSTLLLSNP